MREQSATLPVLKRVEELTSLRRQSFNNSTISARQESSRTILTSLPSLLWTFSGRVRKIARGTARHCNATKMRYVSAPNQVSNDPNFVGSFSVPTSSDLSLALRSARAKTNQRIVNKTFRNDTHWFNPRTIASPSKGPPVRNQSHILLVVSGVFLFYHRIDLLHILASL